jgi:glutamyl-tRNA reductase
MNLFMVGVDHTSAPVAVRECLAFSDTALTEALQELTTPCGGFPPLLSEAVVLSTCNRVEVYGVAADADIEDRIVEFLANFHGLDEEQFYSALFFHFGEEVVQHLFETTSGLRSLVLGEAQIQGQVRKAFTIAQRVRSVGPILSRLFRSAISTGKRVRHETSLGEGAASASQAAIELAEQHLGSLEGCSVLLVGSGKMSELAAQNLLAHGASNLMVVNRTYERGLELAARYGARTYRFADLPQALAEADIVISSTAAPSTVISREQVEAAIQLRAESEQEVLYVNAGGSLNSLPAADSWATTTVAEPEILLIDLAVPRDIDPEVADIPGARLFTVDDLREVISDTMARRSESLAVAREIVAQEHEEFRCWLRSQNALPILSSWRRHAEEVRSAELQRAMRRLSELSPEQQYVVEAFSRSLVNKLLHWPTIRTRNAAATGDGQRYADMLRDLWGF